MTGTNTELKLRIAGMDCANCALTLERSVAQLEGVDRVQVNFTTATLEASGDLDTDAIVGRVRALGYDVAGDEDAARANKPPDERPGGPAGFIRYLLAERRTALALTGSILLVASVPLALLTDAPWIIWLLRGIHVTIALVAGYPIARKGLRSLLSAHQITMDLLMSIGTLGALLIGETGEAATVITLFVVGEALEGYTAERARDSLRSLLALAPDRATVLRPCMDCEEHLGQAGYTGGPCPFCGTHEVTIPVEEVAVGETVLVRPGERIPVDGHIARGTAAVNQAPITGESVPIPRAPGDEVFAGTINGEAALEVEVTRRATDSTISRIVRLVEQAQAQRSPAERFIDRFARWYTPAAVALAALVALIPPLLLGAPLFDTPDGTRGWLYRALALLIVACPCALVISTPVTVVSALTALARRGVLVKGGAFLDTLAGIKVFAFDKTGTLTRGQPVVVQTRTPTCAGSHTRCDACDDMLALAASVERRSEHPLAQAIVAAAHNRDLTHRYAPAEAVQALAGQGVQGMLDGRRILVGSHALFHEQHGSRDALHAQIIDAEAAGQTTILVTQDDELLGFVGVADTPRESSKTALRALKRIDPRIHTVMLTGDNPTVAQAIAQRIGTIDDARAGLLPEDKVKAVKDLQAEYGPVAMVGDGVNDAPALATAAVGVAMGGAGTAQAMETADVVLMQDDLTRLPDAVQTSRRARAIIHQNIIFSLAAKAVFLLLALPGLATLWMAVFADMGASLLVTLNGMRMLRYNAQRANRLRQKRS
jgi:Cd2+/Zn2+-exporting ATPase